MPLYAVYGVGGSRRLPGPLLSLLSPAPHANGEPASAGAGRRPRRWAADGPPTGRRRLISCPAVQATAGRVGSVTQ